MNVEISIKMEIDDSQLTEILNCVERAMEALSVFVPSGSRADIGYIVATKQAKQAWSFNTNTRKLKSEFNV